MKKGQKIPAFSVSKCGCLCNASCVKTNLDAKPYKLIDGIWWLTTSSSARSPDALKTKAVAERTGKLTNTCMNYATALVSLAIYQVDCLFLFCIGSNAMCIHSRFHYVDDLRHFSFGSTWISGFLVSVGSWMYVIREEIQSLTETFGRILTKSRTCSFFPLRLLELSARTMFFCQLPLTS